MRISELSRAGGVPVATVKYYLREGLLPPGTLTSATQATYGDTHLARLRLVRALVEVAGLSIAQVRDVVACLDDPPDSWHDVLGAAHTALPARGADTADADTEHPLADDVVRRRGWDVDPRNPAVTQLDRALRAVQDAGIPMTEERLAAYAEAAERVAEVDVAGVPTGSPEEAAAYVVVGTVLYEPVLLAMRRLAQVDASSQRFASTGSG